MTEEKKAQEPVRETASEIARRLGIDLSLAKLYCEISPLFENTSVTIKKTGTYQFVVYMRDEIHIQCSTDSHSGMYIVHLMKGTRSVTGPTRYTRIAYDTAVERIKKFAQMCM